MSKRIDRRTFIKEASAAGIGVGYLSSPMIFRSSTAPSDRVTVAVMGVNGRGDVLARTFAATEGAKIAYICDVDADVREKTLAALPEHSPHGIGDFRRALDDRDVDALVIAAPDHWHAPATLLALQAGKHVYVEKPCGHNPREGELLVEAQQRHGRVVQMGTQQRSAGRSIRIIEEIHKGLIGRPYFARAWYANTRDSIGRGKPAPAPAALDYELWQGPAPRTAYRDNVIHYNWHWFWRWGTGEICNNGTHEIDVCRWALGVDFPERVTSAGGRYHFDDDWEFPDTQVASFDFEDGKTISWEGRSCNGRPIEGRGRGASIHGEKGTVVLDRSGYVVYDLDNREIGRDLLEGDEDSMDTRGGGGMTGAHIANFVQAVRGLEAPRAPIDDARKSVHLCHLGNIAQRTGRVLRCDPATGKVLDAPEAATLWTREYEPGWEPKV